MITNRLIKCKPKSTPEKVAIYQTRGNIWVKLIFILVIGVFINLIFFVNYIINHENDFKEKIYPNIFIDNVNFGSYTKKQVINYYEKKNNQLKNIRIYVNYQGHPEISFDGNKLGLRYDAQGLADRAFLIGRSNNLSSRVYQKITTLFKLGYFQINTSLEYKKEVVEDFVSKSEEKYNKPGLDALFRFENDRVVSFRKEETGLKINKKQFLDEFEARIQILKVNASNQSINLTDTVITPNITLSKANSYGIEELIGEGVSNYSHSIPERIYNVILASSKFNGVLIPKDAVFSFNDTVGDISAQTGYKPAYIIKGGKTVLGDGGGVCQVSTTFFRAALNTGLPIVERYAHAYRVLYYENDAKPGFDATIYPPSVDLKIRNDTPAYILIQTETQEDKNLLYFRFYGKKDNRKIEISTPSLTDVLPPPDAKYQDDPSLKKGVTKQIDWPAWGGKASFNYKVYYADGKTNEKTFVSYYQPWKAVFQVGTAD